MEEVLVLILQFLFELVLNVFTFSSFDFPSQRRRLPEPEVIWGWGLVWFLVGACVGAVSLLVFNHAIINWSVLRIVNLVVSPVVSAYLSQVVAVRRAQSNPNINPRNHFWYAFWFTLGVAIVRFAYVSR